MKNFGAFMTILILCLCACIGVELIALPNPAGATDASTAAIVQAHTELLKQMDVYFSKLQDKGVLPRPDELNALPDRAKAK